MRAANESKLIKNRKEALAQHLMLDIAEVEDFRYHHGQTSIPVYAVSDSYYCVTTKCEKPAFHRFGMDWSWKEVKDDFLNQNGYKIWESKS